jgi:hypothetical protein
MRLGVAIFVCDGVPPRSIAIGVSLPSTNLHTSLSCLSGPHIGALCHSTGSLVGIKDTQ